MYHKLKLFLKSFLPRKLLYSNELFFRYFYYLLYRGKKYQCNICNKKLSRFIQTSGENLICPACGSLSRNRRLWKILVKDFLKPDSTLLHFSPSRSLYRKLKKEKSITYCSSDFSGEFIADKRLDITNIQEPDNMYDIIICYHVLEHIEDDKKALHELYRILKQGGVCIIQTPFKEGDIYEDPAITLPQQRLQHFGQKDHVRIYSATGLKERLSKTGFNSEIIEFKENKINYHGFKQNEIVIIAKK